MVIEFIRISKGFELPSLKSLTSSSPEALVYSFSGSHSGLINPPIEEQHHKHGDVEGSKR